MTASSAQLGFIRNLIRGRFASIVDAQFEFGIETGGSLTKSQASAMIDWLKSLNDSPERSAARDAQVARHDSCKSIMDAFFAKQITRDEMLAALAARG